MSLEGTDAAGVKRWRCETCDVVAPWTESSLYFGSLLDAEYPGDLPTFCSDACAAAWGRKEAHPLKKVIDARFRHEG